MICRWLRIAAVIFILITAVSCSLKSDDTAFLSELDVIDALILHGDVDSAVKRLHKAESKALNVYSTLGIYRRYVLMGNDIEAQRFISSAVKKNPDNAELSAVYVHFLLRHDKVSEALELGKKLAGSKYESLYSEAVFKNMMNSGRNSLFEEYLKESFVSVFKAAYNTSGNSAWLKNCALIAIKNDKIKEAVKFQPEQIFTADDACFWALVQYDASCFLEASQNFTLAQNLLSVSLRKDRNELLARISALKADALLKLGEYEAAQQERDFLLTLISVPENLQFVPVTYVNSAYWAYLQGNPEKRYEFLFRAVEEFPDYVPGLFAYAAMAYEQSLPQKASFYETFLRNSGLKTLEMQKYDKIPKASVPDALARMDSALKKNQDPLLAVLKKELEYKTEEIPDSVKIADVWKMLESNAGENGLCPPVMIHYAADTFLGLNQKDEAERIFSKYIKRRYKFDSSADFYVQLLANKSVFDGWECDYAAYFALEHKSVDVARELYEYLVFCRPEYSAEKTSDFAYSPAVNLAMLYSSTGKRQKALDLYSIKSGSVYDSGKRSEILYRIACIQNQENKRIEALKTLEYAVKLNPLNEKAHLLLMQLKK